MTVALKKKPDFKRKIFRFEDIDMKKEIDIALIQYSGNLVNILL